MESQTQPSPVNLLSPTNTAINRGGSTLSVYIPSSGNRSNALASAVSFFRLPTPHPLSREDLQQRFKNWKKSQDHRRILPKGLGVGVGLLGGTISGGIFAMVAIPALERLGLLSKPLEDPVEYAKFFAFLIFLAETFGINFIAGYIKLSAATQNAINSILDSVSGERSITRNSPRFAFELIVDGAGFFLSAVFAQSLLHTALSGMQNLEINFDANPRAVEALEGLITFVRTVFVGLSWRSWRRLETALGKQAFRSQLERQVVSTMREKIVRFKRLVDTLKNANKKTELLILLSLWHKASTWKELIQLFDDPNTAIRHVDPSLDIGEELVHALVVNKTTHWHRLGWTVSLSVCATLGGFFAFGQEHNTELGLVENWGMSASGASALTFTCLSCIMLFATDWVYGGGRAVADVINTEADIMSKWRKFGVFSFTLFFVILSAITGLGIAIDNKLDWGLTVMLTLATLAMNLLPQLTIINWFDKKSWGGRSRQDAEITGIPEGEICEKLLSIVTDELDEAIWSPFAYTHEQISGIAGELGLLPDLGNQEALLRDEPPIPQSSRLESIREFFAPVAAEINNAQHQQTASAPANIATGAPIQADGGVMNAKMADESKAAPHTTLTIPEPVQSFVPENEILDAFNIPGRKRSASATTPRHLSSVDGRLRSPHNITSSDISMARVVSINQMRRGERAKGALPPKTEEPSS